MATSECVKLYVQHYNMLLWKNTYKTAADPPPVCTVSLDHLSADIHSVSCLHASNDTH